MRTFATLIVLASVSLSSAPLWAAEPATAPAPAPAPTSATQPKPTTPAPVAKPAPAKTDEKAAAPVAQDKPAAPPARTEDKAAATTAADAKDAKPSPEQKASPQRFIPSEQVRADFDVSFPIDI
jgi:hypothetical protein